MKPSLVLNPSWERVDNPSVPFTFMRMGRSNSNALQISFAWNKERKHLDKNTTVEILASKLVEDQLNGIPLRKYAGNCRYGKFASIIFSAENFAHCQVWFISNGIHFLAATFICDAPPALEELAEAEAMALSLCFKEPPKKRRWWPLW